MKNPLLLFTLLFILVISCSKDSTKIDITNWAHSSNTIELKFAQNSKGKIVTKGSNGNENEIPFTFTFYYYKGMISYNYNRRSYQSNYTTSENMETLILDDPQFGGTYNTQ